MLSSVLVLTMSLAAWPAGAQDFDPVAVVVQPPPPTPTARPPQPAPQPGQPPGTLPVPLPMPPPAGPPKRSVNVQVEVTISDQMGTSAPEKKTVSMISTDGTWGRIRTGANARPNERVGNVSSTINVDARPFVVPGQSDQIQVEVTIEYRPLRALTAGDASQMEPTILNQSMSVLLTNGKPLQISQAADPISDRRVLVEVKATVLK
jgi:hypothetical protein